MPKYQGKNVTMVERKAREGDQGYDQNARDQVVIRLEDGTEKAVPKSEVTPQ